MILFEILCACSFCLLCVCFFKTVRSTIYDLTIPVFLFVFLILFPDLVWLWYDILKIRSEPCDQSYGSDLIWIWAFLSFNFSTVLLFSLLFYLLHLFLLKTFSSKFTKNIMLWFNCLSTIFFYYCYLIFALSFYIISCIFYFSSFYVIIVRSLVCIIGFDVI